MAIDVKNNDLVQRIIDSGISVNDKVTDGVARLVCVMLLMSIYCREVVGMVLPL